MARAMYPRCAILVRTPFEHCELHHVIWWRHHGRTDLDNLVPLCKRPPQGSRRRLALALHPQTRVLTVTYPDGTTERCHHPEPDQHRLGATHQPTDVPDDASSLFDPSVW